ncbi:energy-coupling factor transporter transmembrane component T family protein [Thermanaeromonas sp. C210]|uniref:energy-coupling factor transporter transmembrane component T family protein n=1 Tax=Thermanaeromonas sp. C210 TaxID=2731925 RepID=UPI00155BB073|nr:energy-coupling factor transporter transmembrane component T [Thermanaeromonas sp. C210]GFN22354.1 cobalt ABC transporter permease [Thermanaeromonas sp. C210]
MPVGYSIYIEKDSYIHNNLDPRTKLVWLVSMFLLSLLFNHPVPLAIFLLLVIGMGLLARLELRALVPFLLASVWFLLLGVLIWPFYIKQGAVAFHVFEYEITWDGILFGLAMGLRVALMVTAAAVWMMTTSPQKMMLGLLRMGLPYKAGMALSSAIRFVPLINAERLTISEAQRARGLDLERGSSFSKAIKYVGVIGPLLLRSFGLTQSLAVAMDCRGFGARPRRTSIFEIGFQEVDKWVMFICLLALVGGIICRILGIGILVKGYL